jgi:hypothetical protein
VLVGAGLALALFSAVLFGVLASGSRAAAVDVASGRAPTADRLADAVLEVAVLPASITAGVVDDRRVDTLRVLVAVISGVIVLMTVQQLQVAAGRALTLRRAPAVSRPAGRSPPSRRRA